MNSLWRLIFAIGAVLLAGMALFAIWYETIAPVVFAKAFVSLVIVGLVLSVLQTALRRSPPPAE